MLHKFSVLKAYKGEAIFTVANIIQSAASMLMSVIAAAFIDPVDFGIYHSVSLILIYASFMHLGIFNGLNRNLAYYKAQGNMEIMQKCIDTSHTVSVFVASISGMVGIGVLLYFIICGFSAVYICSAIALLVMLICQPLSNHLECTFRSGQQFGILGNIKNIQSGVFTVLSFLPYFFGLFGKVFADISSRIVALFLLEKNKPYPHQSRGDWQTWKDLFFAGAPLLLGGYIWQIFVVSDRTYIATHLSSEDMGLYTLAGYCISIFAVLPAALNTLLYPKAAAHYGQSGNKRDLLSFWRKSIILFSAVLIPLALVAYFVIPWGVNLFLPKYEEGIEVARISLLTCLTFVSMGPSVIFGTLKKNKGYIIVVLACWGAFWLTTTLFPQYFTTIESVALLRFALSFILMIYTILQTYLLITK